MRRVRSRPVAIAALTAALAVIASVLARLVVNEHVSGPARAYAYTDLQNILVVWPFLELHWPYLRFPFDYHPLLGWMTGLLTTLAGGEMLTVIALWAIVLAATAAAVAVLLTRLAPAGRVMGYWSLSPQLWLLGGHNFDVIPVLGLVAAAVAMRAGRASLAGAALGLGAAAKLFPIAALPPLAVSLARTSPRAAAAAIAGAALVLVAIDGPAILAPFGFLSTAHNPYRHSGGNLETVWLPVRAALDLAHVPPDPIVAVVSGIGMAASYLWWVIRPALRGGDPVPLFWRAVVIILLWTQLFSPQYSVWLLPIFVLQVPRRDVFLLLASGDLLVWLCAFPLAVEVSDPLIAGLLGGILLRHAALALLLRSLVRDAPRGSGAG